MNKSQNIIQRLRQLDDLERQIGRLPKNGTPPPGITQQIDLLRSQIPTSILKHHDRMRARDKTSVAPVRRGVCGACHLAIPIGHQASLRVPNDLNVCDNCGAFIYLADEELLPNAQSQSAISNKSSNKSIKKSVKRKRSVSLQPVGSL